MEKQYDEKIPVTVYGTDSRGEMFIEDAYTRTVARGWVTLPLRHRMSSGAEIVIFNKVNGNQAEFRLESQEAGVFKAMLKDLSVDIWEKDFGLPPEPQPDLRMRVHIVCNRCQTHESVPLEDEEVDRILEGQALRRHCAQCVTETDWYSPAVVAEHQEPAAVPVPPALQPRMQPPEVEAQPEAAPQPAPAAPPEAAPSGAERRASRRIQMKTRARVRRAATGAAEVVAPSNVSRGGIAFDSRVSYELEEIIHVAMHYREGGEALETPGRIVRVSRAEDRYGYGVKFEV